MKTQDEEDFVDRALDVGAEFDWMTPLISIIQNVIGQDLTFSVWREDADAVIALLGENGIKPIREDTHGNYYTFDLRNGQKRYGEYLLKQKGYVE